jgi:hypothetical protein
MPPLAAFITLRRAKPGLSNGLVAQATNVMSKNTLHDLHATRILAELTEKL